MKMAASAPAPAPALQQLPVEVCHGIRSHFIILNTAVGIEECVVNSIDAGANQIHVKLNLEQAEFR